MSESSFDDDLHKNFPDWTTDLVKDDDLAELFGSVDDEEVERVASLEQDEKEKKVDLTTDLCDNCGGIMIDCDCCLILFCLDELGTTCERCRKYICLTCCETELGDDKKLWICKKCEIRK